jgi:hypothetical protein
MAGQKKSFLLRIDPEIYDALEKWSEDEFRSVNAHLEYLLRDALKRAGRLSKKPTSDNSKNSGEEQ